MGEQPQKESIQPQDDTVQPPEPIDVGLTFVDEEIKFPDDYWGIVDECTYYPTGVPRSRYAMPTMDLVITALKPKYDKKQHIFVPVPLDDNKVPIKELNVQTYTGAFVKQLLDLGFRPPTQVNNVLELLKTLSGVKGHLLRQKVGERTQSEKWIFVALGDPPTE